MFILVAETSATREVAGDGRQRALVADGLSTMLATVAAVRVRPPPRHRHGCDRVYSTAAYIIAAGVALVDAAKFGALIATFPGRWARRDRHAGRSHLWVQNPRRLLNPVNLLTAAVALIIAIADFTWLWAT